MSLRLSNPILFVSKNLAPTRCQCWGFNPKPSTWQLQSKLPGVPRIVPGANLAGRLKVKPCSFREHFWVNVCLSFLIMASLDIVYFIFHCITVKPSRMIYMSALNLGQLSTCLPLIYTQILATSVCIEKRKKTLSKSG